MSGGHAAAAPDVELLGTRAHVGTTEIRRLPADSRRAVQPDLTRKSTKGLFLMPDEEKKVSRRKLLSRVPIFVSVGSLAVSGLSLGISYKNEKRQSYDATTNFNVIQNLWTNDPSFSLYNESTKKLDQPPSPTYLMAIPSKVYWFAEGVDSAGASTLVLLPISYDVILEQVKTGETVGVVEESRLPASFFAKVGARDVVRSDEIEIDGDLHLVVETLPFVLIVATIEYSLVGSDDASVDQIITTPLGRYQWAEDRVTKLKEYFRDNAKFEVPLPDTDSDQSVYDIAHEILVQEAKDFGPKNASLFGGVKDGYDYILKELNPIVTPRDPLEP